jgi:hypothetical protein
MFKRRIIDTAKFKEVSIEDVLYTIRPDNENILTDLYYREVEFDKEVEEEINPTEKTKVRDIDYVMLSEIIKYSKGVPYEYEKMLAKCFPITHTFIGSTLYTDPLYYPTCENGEMIGFHNSLSPNYIYSSNMYMFIFPNVGIRICGPQDFVNNLPYFETIVSGKFMEQVNYLPVILDSKGENENPLYVKGPTIYICHAPVEMILYDTGDQLDGHITVSLWQHIQRALGFYH